jgi:hypothetical protein
METNTSESTTSTSESTTSTSEITKGETPLSEIESTTSENTTKKSETTKRESATSTSEITTMDTTLSTDKYLTHYWPICYSTMLDVIETAHMTQGSSTFFITDRFGNENGALALNGGFTQVPSGIYFDTPEFTISVWILPQQVGRWARVIDFGNGPASANIILAISNFLNLQPSLVIYTESNAIYKTMSYETVLIDKWQFLTATFNSTDSLIYLNGTLKANFSHGYLNLTSIQRPNCFIGKSNWVADGYSNSIIDELRFYNKSLTQKEIIQLMNQNETGYIF